MMGRVTTIYGCTDAHAKEIGHPVWYVSFDVLGFTDYQAMVRPWCNDNLAGQHTFIPSSFIEVTSYDDAILMKMRWS